MVSWRFMSWRLYPKILPTFIAAKLFESFSAFFMKVISCIVISFINEFFSNFNSGGAFSAHFAIELIFEKTLIDSSFSSCNIAAKSVTIITTCKIKMTIKLEIIGSKFSQIDNLPLTWFTDKISFVLVSKLFFETCNDFALRMRY